MSATTQFTRPSLFSPFRRAGVPLTLLTILLSGLVAVPMVAVLVTLLSPAEEVWAHLVQTNLFTYTRNTLTLMLLVGIMTTVIGVATAWLVTMTRFPGRRLFNWLLILPLAAPAYIIAYLYTDLLAYEGPVQATLRGWVGTGYWFPQIRSIPGAALMLSLVLYPYVYLLSRAAFTAQAGNQLQAARTLGLNAWQMFRRVALPGARPAIAGGLALVLMETLADFGVADYFAVSTFSTGIFRTWLAMGEKEAAMKLAGIMLLFVIILISLEAATRRGRVDNQARSTAPLEPFKLSAVQQVLALIVCSLPILLGFVIPIAGLLSMTVEGGDPKGGLAFLEYARNSVRIAVMAAILASAIAIILAYSQRQSASPFTRGMIRLSTLGYALPGTLLAVGLLGPVGNIDRPITGFFATHFGWEGGLVLTGTLAILTYACVIRFLTVSFNAVSGNLIRISPTVDAAARSLGATPREVIRRIHLPLIRPGLMAGALLVFVDVMRELPATLILRPFNFETLATRVYRLASDERLAEASTAALAIVVIGLIPVLLLNRVGED